MTDEQEQRLVRAKEKQRCGHRRQAYGVGWARCLDCGRGYRNETDPDAAPPFAPLTIGPIEIRATPSWTGASPRGERPHLKCDDFRAQEIK